MKREDGFTLVDVVVTMSVLSVVMAIFTTGMVQMYTIASKNESLTTAQAQNTTAFLRLDRELRYATGISVPGSVAADDYVEYLTTNTGTARCTQLRLTSGGLLQRREWVQGATPGTWQVLASSVSADTPFERKLPASTYGFQQLKITLRITGPDAKVLAETRVTFTALNTTINTASDTVCVDGRAAP
jgi:type II secretory pathway pseudopilin PulG